MPRASTSRKSDEGSQTYNAIRREKHKQKNERKLAVDQAYANGIRNINEAVERIAAVSKERSEEVLARLGLLLRDNQSKKSRTTTWTEYLHQLNEDSTVALDLMRGAELGTHYYPEAGNCSS